MATTGPTLKEILSKFGLEEASLDKGCPREVRREIAIKLEDWEMAGHFLDFTSEKLLDIKRDNNSQELCKVALLEAWSKREGKGATYLKLARVLHHRGRGDLVEFLCGSCVRVADDQDTPTVERESQPEPQTFNCADDNRTQVMDVCDENLRVMTSPSHAIPSGGKVKSGYYRDKIYLKNVPEEEQKRIIEETKKGYIPDLTIENVIKHTYSLNGEQLANCLRVLKPYGKFLRKYGTDERCKVALVEFWLQRDPLASWRRIIKELDAKDHLEIADKIRHYAGKLADSTLTEENICAVLNGVKDLDVFLEVPPCVMQRITDYYNNGEDYTDQIVHYWMNFSPKPSWSWLAGWLHYFEEKNALAIAAARKYVKRAPEPTLTLENLKSCLDIISDYKLEDFAMYLDIPRSKGDNSWAKCKSLPQRKVQYWKYWLNHHPTPSWTVMVDSLWMAGEYEALDQVLHKFYLKGEYIEKLRDDILRLGDEIMFCLRNQEDTENIHLLKYKVSSLASSAIQQFNITRSTTDSKKLLGKHQSSPLDLEVEQVEGEESLTAESIAGGHKRKSSPGIISTSSKRMRVTEGMDTKLDLQASPQVCAYINELDRHQIIHLGVNLGLSYASLDKMKSLPQDMVAAWLRQEGSVLRARGDPTWRSLVFCLRKVGEEDLAERIEDQFS